MLPIVIKEGSLLVVSQAQQVQFADEACALLIIFMNICKGIAVVTDTQALLWTDGRYHLQASCELNNDLWTLMRQGYLICIIEEYINHH